MDDTTVTETQEPNTFDDGAAGAAKSRGMDVAANGPAGATAGDGWLLLIHQLPAEPAYLRVRILRRLKAAGAVALKNSVYVLPENAAALEDFHWIRREVVDGGGEATLSTVRFLEGTTPSELKAAFGVERDREYEEVAAAARAAHGAAPTRSDIERLRRRLEAIVERDYFGAPQQASARHALRALEEAIAERDAPAGSVTAMEADVVAATGPHGATWVTRAGVFIDRMASAWLIRRFIDDAARFEFVTPEGYEPKPDEIRFDMWEGEYTHEGDRCTFETLVARFGLKGAGLAPIAEIVHDLDCRDGKYGRAEAVGIGSVIRGIAASHARDEDRIQAATHVFDALYARFAADIG
jgi:hypothetical protein